MLDRINSRCILACIFIVIACVIAMQTDEEGRQLMRDFHGLAMVVLACVILVVTLVADAIRIAIQMTQQSSSSGYVDY